MKRFLKNFTFILTLFILYVVNSRALLDLEANLKYEIKNNSEVSITGVEKADLYNENFILNIPSFAVIDNKKFKVTSFSDCDIENYERLVGLILPETFKGNDESVKNIINFINKCPNLKSISVNKNCEELSNDFQGILYDKTKTKLIACPRGKKQNMVIPNTVLAIHTDAFRGCSKLPRSVNIPFTVRYVGSNLESLKFEKSTNEVKKANDIKINNNKDIDSEKIAIILLGESGCGKTTAAEHLKKYDYQNIPTYTTRKPRYNDEKGHIFLNRDLEKNLISEDEEHHIVYITYFADNWYWAYEEQIKSSDKIVMAFNPSDTKNFRECVKNRKIIIFYLKTDRATREARMSQRVDKEKVSQKDLQKDINSRMNLEDSEYSHFYCNYVIDTSFGIDATINSVDWCLEQEKLI